MTVLVGYKPTAPGEAAFERGVAEAAGRGEDLVVLNSPRRGATVDADMIDDVASAKLVERAAARGVIATVEQGMHGADVVDAFEEVVARTGADLVVIGLRRRSPVGKLVMGSAAQRLLLQLEVPVLAVKAAR
jgi:nucleotide-binding universal stress UspA family protein